jgi:hypothetical protein
VQCNAAVGETGWDWSWNQRIMFDSFPLDLLNAGKGRMLMDPVAVLNRVLEPQFHLSIT